MNDRLDTLLDQIRQLERELIHETQKKEEEFCYKMKDRKAHFTEAARAKHKELRVGFHRYLLHSRFLVIITSPVIWMCAIPIFLCDLVGTIYQAICFPIYGIPKVRRRDYVVMDRGRLLYLNSMERFNCVYCGYVNGVLAYVQEIAGRTEQHWCPIKHAVSLKTRHSRYQHFLDYGDAEQYCKRLEEVRRDFADLKKASMSAALPLNSRINES